MGRKRSSPIWMMDQKEFENLVNSSDTISDILAYFKLQNKGRNCDTLKRRILDSGLDLNRLHVNGKNRMFNILEQHHKKSKTLEEIMVQNSSYSRKYLKIKLLKNGILKNECQICGQLGEWNGKSLKMILDHINGISNDHRIENLRMVCPNCNSQLETFAGKKNKKTHLCRNCGEEKKTKKSVLCINCSNREKSTIVKNELLKKELQELVKVIPISQIAKKYNVSDTSIRKWCKKLNINLT